MSTQIKQMFPFSPQQRRLWALQREGGAAAFHARCALLIEGTLDIERLRDALLGVVARHEILRTTFHESDESDAPAQAVTDCGISWECHDVGTRDAGLPEIGLGDFARGAEDFVPHAGHEPPVRASLVRIAEARHVLDLALPALCADAPTLKKLMREIGRAYAAAADGVEPEEPLQYADVSQWLNELLESEQMRAGREYWRRQAAGSPAGFRLALERPLPPPGLFGPKRVQVEIEGGLLSKIEGAAEALVTRPELLLHAAWQGLLWNHGERPDEIVVGTAYDGLNYEELAGALGPLTKYLPIRCRLDADLTFGELVRQTAGRAQEAYDRQQFYFAAEAGGDGEPGSEPFFFPYCFDFDDEEEPFEAGGLALSIYGKYVCTDRFKLKLTCTRRRGALLAEIHYDANLFSATEVESLASQFRTLLAGAAEDVESPLGRLPLLCEDERRLLLAGSRGPTAPLDPSLCAHELFAARAALTPDSLAVSCGQDCLSYAELDSRAERLARRLRSAGIGPGRIVALCLPRSAELVVAMLGIFKAGGAYLPLDPSYPLERLELMREDAAAPMLLTRSSLLGSLPPHWGQTILLDEWEDDGEGEAEGVDEAEARRTTPADLAYVIYTSGSTGKPKGVMVSHSGLVNLMEAQAQAFGLSPDDRVLQFASLSFDASVSEIFVTLCAGASLHLSELDPLLLSATLVEVLREERITAITLPPSVLAVTPYEELPELRTLIVAGESCPAEIVASWGRGRRFLNAYGPTENTVCATVAECTPDGGRPSIGRAIANVTAYVLDARLEPIPVGISGQLYVGGAGVARGYHRRPALTAERFIPDPFSSEPGTRLYQTGDLVRYLPDGNIEFLGRADHQIKVRGFRIEPGEVEAALLRHPSVRECVVIDRETATGDKRLVACVVLGAGEKLTGGELREHAQQYLPGYMLPTEWVRLEKLPLTSNGKVDRKALGELAKVGSAAESMREYVAPRTITEELLCAIWQDLLGVEHVGVNDGFFDLGGHSLLGTQMISRVVGAFNVELPLRSLFEYPTLGELARHVEEAMAQSNGLTRPPIERVPRGGDLAVSYNVEGRLRAEEFLRTNSLSVRPQNISLAFHWSGPLDRDVLERSLNELVRRHEVLRSGFSVVEGRPVQRIVTDMRVPLRVMDIRDMPGDEREAEARRLLAAEELERFDLAEAPLLRAVLVRLAEEEYVAAFVVDHSVFDGWSVGVFFSEITSLYRAFSADSPSPLAELTIQYADFAAWQRNWMQGEVLERMLGYWRKQLTGHGVFPELELPGGRPREEIKSFHGAGCAIRLSAELSRELQALGRRSGATSYMILLAGLKALLQRRTGLESIGLITPVAYRNTVETESPIGWFSNVLVLRTDLSGDPTFSELLARVRETALGAFSHQDIPFRLLKSELAQPEPPGAKPKVQPCVFFSMNSEPVSGQREESADVSPMPGARLRRISINSKTAEPGLSVIIDASTEAFDIVINYEAECFEPAVMTTLLEHFEGLLVSVVADPEQLLSAIPLLTRAERNI